MEYTPFVDNIRWNWLAEVSINSYICMFKGCQTIPNQSDDDCMGWGTYLLNLVTTVISTRKNTEFVDNTGWNSLTNVSIDLHMHRYIDMGRGVGQVHSQFWSFHMEIHNVHGRFLLELTSRRLHHLIYRSYIHGDVKLYPINLMMTVWERGGVHIFSIWWQQSHFSMQNTPFVDNKRWNWLAEVSINSYICMLTGCQTLPNQSDDDCMGWGTYLLNSETL